MTLRNDRKSAQEGFMLIEGLMAILIFSFGILGMVALAAKGVSAQSDAQYRTEAAILADQIAGTIALGVNRSGAFTVATQLQDFATPSTNAAVLAWLDKVTVAPQGLPGATVAMQSIVVNGNIVTITVSWQAPTDTAVRRNILITHVN